MERIAKLLFFSGAVVLFAVLATYTMVNLSGNGGEYWGFDGRELPYEAAVGAYNSGDYRFLAFDFATSLGKKVSGIPSIRRCQNHPNETEGIARPTITDEIHGRDSLQLAGDFASMYNIQLADLLNEERDARCEILRVW